MELHDLNVFVTAARFGSVTRAATALSTVQPNVTARIRLLERELAVQLFHRTHRGITLTAKGKELLPYAQQMLALAQSAKAAMGNVHDVGGTLEIGSLQSTAAARLPELLKAYAAKHDRVDISIATGTAAELTAKVLECRLDGAFVAGVEDHPELDIVASFAEELVMVTPASYRSVRDYFKQGALPKVLVFKVGCHYRQRLERYIADEGVGVSSQMEFGTIDGIIGCVAAGLGITMLPRSVVERSARRGDVAVHTLPATYRRADTQFITRKAQIRSPALERLIDVIRSDRAPAARPAKRRA